MSAIIKECKVKLVRLTKEEIEKHTGKTYNGAEVVDSTTDRKPIISVRRDIGDSLPIGIRTQDTKDTSALKNDDIDDMEINETQDTKDTSALKNDDIDGMEINETQDTENTSALEIDDIDDMEINETQDTEDSSSEENDFIPFFQNIPPPPYIQIDGINDVEINGTQDANDISDLENDEINDMEIEVTQDIEYMSGFGHYGINDMEINETQDTEDTSEETVFIPFIPNITTPPYIQNDGINNVGINGTQVADNIMYAGPSGLMPNMSFQQYGVDNNTTAGNDCIYNQPTTYNPNLIIKQEIEDDSYGTDTTQVAGCSQVMIKQEVIDEGYEQSYDQGYNQSYIPQGDHNVYGEYIPNDQPTQNVGMQSYINPETSNMTNGSNSRVIIKQEILDDGNIETYTDLLKPPEDQEHEDGNPC